MSRFYPGGLMKGLTHGAGGGGAAAFDWTGIEAPFDPAIISSLFKDVAGTAVVSADGDDVAAIRHPVTNALLWVAPDTTNCFTYRANSGKPYIQAKTTASYLQYNPGASVLGQEMLAFRTITLHDGDRIMSPGSTGDQGLYLYNKAGGAFEIYNGGNNITSAASFGAGVDCVIEAITTGSSGSTPPWGDLYVNNVATGGGSSTTPGAINVHGANIGTGGQFGGSTADGRFYGGFFSTTQVTGARRTAIFNYLSGKY